ncbi:MAG: hypothetical protein JHD15_24295 [Phenylobacterium sp.]|uniref:hypothetical protein n=1 Tax=Phenylobacterium sp. TaxID=1871053 RepID=UPI001A279BA6|nr:hypothetical protein [Phenylobacterium sp.]MBJ7413454.1 hypothetical protein [Phenylobacterium sp.]
MATQAGSARRGMSRRPGWVLALLLSAALHLVMLGWFALKRAAGAWRADPQIVSVQLVRVLPPGASRPQASSRPPMGRVSRSTPPPTDAPGLASTAAAASMPPGTAIDPRWMVNRTAARAGASPGPDIEEFLPCDPLRDPKRESPACRKVDEIARSVTRANDPQDAKGEFAREARHNEAGRRYREAPGMAGYAGIRCHVFHRC